MSFLEYFRRFFNKKSNSSEEKAVILPKKEEKIFFPLTVADILTSSGKYPDREKSPECTEEVRKNAEELIKRVNPLLKELGFAHGIVSSGFRTQAANSAIPNAAAKSSHMLGKAVDLVDSEGKLDEALLNNQNLLTKYDLFLEHPEATKGWTHLDIKTRQNRIFKV